MPVFFKFFKNIVFLTDLCRPLHKNSKTDLDVQSCRTDAHESRVSLKLMPWTERITADGGENKLQPGAFHSTLGEGSFELFLLFFFLCSWVFLLAGMSERQSSSLPVPFPLIPVRGSDVMGFPLLWILLLTRRRGKKCTKLSTASEGLVTFWSHSNDVFRGLTSMCFFQSRCRICENKDNNSGGRGRAVRKRSWADVEIRKSLLKTQINKQTIDTGCLGTKR